MSRLLKGQSFFWPPLPFSETSGPKRVSRLLELRFVQRTITNYYLTSIGIILKAKLWSNGGVHGSRSEGRWFEPRPILNGSGVKAMPGKMILS
jgi:hypothetical protein